MTNEITSILFTDGNSSATSVDKNSIRNTKSLNNLLDTSVNIRKNHTLKVNWEQKPKHFKYLFESKSKSPYSSDDKLSAMTIFKKRFSLMSPLISNIVGEELKVEEGHVRGELENKEKCKTRRSSGPATYLNIETNEKKTTKNYEKLWKLSARLITKEIVSVSKALKYIQTKNDKKLKMVLNQVKSKVDFEDLRNQYLLQEASYQGNHKALLILIQYGFDVHEIDEENWTVLHSAVMGGNLKTINFLLQTYELDVNSENIEGLTCLHLAIYLDDIDIVQLLLKWRANPLIESNYSTATPFQMAINLKRTSILDYLIHQEVFLVTEVGCH